MVKLYKELINWANIQMFLCSMFKFFHAVAKLYQPLVCILSDVDAKDADKHANVKHVVDMKNQLIEAFLSNKNNLSNQKQCPHCKMPVKRLVSENSAKIIIYSRGSKNRVIAKTNVKTKKK